MGLEQTLMLNDGRAMPQLGLGVYLTPAAENARVVGDAIASGYRHVDSAAVYRNEKGVGEAVRAAAGRDVWVTTKLWNDQQGFDAAREAFDRSLGRLGLESVDLYLIHWPAPKKDLYVESWKALITLREEGRARSIGVSNFQPEHLKRIIDETGVIPAVNQVELHPRFQQHALRAVHAEYEIATESWSPLGQAKGLDDSVLSRIAAKHGRTPAQVVIRWHLDSGLIVIPKSVHPQRIRENADVFDFRLDPEDLDRIAALDSPDGRIGPDPLTADF